MYEWNGQTYKNCIWQKEVRNLISKKSYWLEVIAEDDWDASELAKIYIMCNYSENGDILDIGCSDNLGYTNEDEEVIEDLLYKEINKR